MNGSCAACWIGICLHRLPIEVFTRGDGTPGAAAPALAVADARTVLMANAAAEAAGVLPGTRRSSALALCPDLRILARAPHREREALEQAACWALQFTPSVSLQGSPEPRSRAPSGPPPSRTREASEGATLPCGLLLEVGPSLRLFGGRQGLVSRIRPGLAALGFSASIATAPNPSAAWLLALNEAAGRPGLSPPARGSDRGKPDPGSAPHVDDAHTGDAQMRARLASLPIELLAAARPHLDTLESIGVRRLRDLAQLPRAGIARRFGQPLLEALDRALGQRAEPRAWFTAPATFEAKLELMASVENSEALLFGAQRLVTQLAGWLSARHAAARAIELFGEHEEPPPAVFTARFAEPVREPSRMLGVLRETLAVRGLRAPVQALRLCCDDITPLPEASADLFPMPATNEEGLGRLVERMQARLGRDQVQRLLLASDHRPEHAYRSEPFEAARPARHGSAPGVDAPGREAVHGGPGLPRPLWLLARPIAIGERNNRPFWHGPLDLLAGPERIESGWWDGRFVQRDYFIAADASGALLWLYRERRPDPAGRGGWFVHGRFA